MDWCELVETLDFDDMPRQDETESAETGASELAEMIGWDAPERIAAEPALDDDGNPF